MAYFTNEFKGVDYFEDIDFHHLETCQRLDLSLSNNFPEKKKLQNVK